MDRKDFFSALGMTAGAAIFTTCLGGCKKDAAAVPDPPTVDFQLDLSAPQNAALNTTGGYVYANGVVIAKAVSGALVAVAQACTHVGTDVQYQAGQNRFYCPNHFATFTTSGQIITGPVTVPLKMYQVTVNGNMARVFG